METGAGNEIELRHDDCTPDHNNRHTFDSTNQCLCICLKNDIHLKKLGGSFQVAVYPKELAQN